MSAPRPLDPAVWAPWLEPGEIRRVGSNVHAAHLLGETDRDFAARLRARAERAQHVDPSKGPSR